MQLSCPTKGRLREFLEGTVDDAEANQISEHVAECPSCERTMCTLESEQGEITQVIRAGLKVDHLLDEPEFHELRKTVTTSNASTAGASSALEDDPSSGTRLRDYRLVKKIGEGGMGTVYQAVHVHLGKAVALKILPTDKLQSKQSVARFKQEMRSVGKVNHPNVISASDAGSVDGMHFLVMELVEGADLARIIRDQGALEIADACEIIRQAALGLQHAHDNGLVHRDVKPSNLMLDLEGSVKVLDLGLAGLNSATIGPTANVVVTDRLTSVGQIMGTLDYMAPEQITASAHVDYRADLYALGATLFQLLTGKTPCGNRADEIPERIEAVLHDPPIEVSTLREVPSELSHLLNSMLSKSVPDRPESAASVASALSCFCADSDLVRLAEVCRTSLDIPSADVDVTDDVSFIVSREESRATDKLSQKPASTSTRSLLVSHRWKLSVVGLCLAVLLIASWLSIVTFRTKEGIVRVEIPDGVKGIQVVLSQDDKPLQVLDPSAGWEFQVEHGKYDVRLRGNTDRLEVGPNSIVVSRDGAVRVRITTVQIDTKTPKPIVDPQLHEPSFPYSACKDDFRLLKLHWYDGEISDVTMTPDGRMAIFALGWRPGKYDVWDLSKLEVVSKQKDFDDYLLDSQVIHREPGGQPTQSVAFHPKNQIAAIGRWYGAVDIIDLDSHDIIATYIHNEGKSRKANGVAFSHDGDVLLIGYQSARLVVWDWKRNKVIRQKTFPKPVWEVRVSPKSDDALIGGQIGEIWNWKTGESRHLRADVNHAGVWSIDGNQASLMSGNELYVFDAASGHVLNKMLYDHPINSHVVLKNTNRVITGHYNGELRLTDFDEGKSVLLAHIHSQHRVGFMEIDDANQVLLTASGKRINPKQPADRQIAIWSLSEELQSKPLGELEQQNSKSVSAGIERRQQFDKWRQFHLNQQDLEAQPDAMEKK